MKYSRSILESNLCKPLEGEDLPQDKARLMRASTFAEVDVSPLLINESPRLGLYQIGNDEDDFITAIDQLVCETEQLLDSHEKL